MKLSPASAQRGIAAVAVLLLAALVGLAVAARFRDSPSGLKLPAPVGDWYQARAAPLRAGLEGITTACSVVLEQETMGISDPVLPCGAKIYVGYGDEDVLTQVIGTGPGPAGTRFGLTSALAESLGIERPVTVRWSYAR
ncbi:MAG TPA: hypothetical protein VKC65_04840 [Gaiellaceae bacterium]|nr:hypothetical protein [Gaiellaceae bacterium]